MYIVICSLIFFYCCTLVIWFSVPFLFYPRLSSPRQFLILSLPFLSHLFASSLLPFSLPLLSSPRLLFPFFYIYLLSSMHASLVRVYGRLSSSLFSSVSPLISCISPLPLSSFPLCMFSSPYKYVHMHIHACTYTCKCIYRQRQEHGMQRPIIKPINR